MREGLNDTLKCRLQVVFNNGRFVASHALNNYSFLLYSVDSDFVEILYDRRSNAVVWVMKANNQDLAKYLNAIKVDFHSLLV